MDQELLEQIVRQVIQEMVPSAGSSPVSGGGVAESALDPERDYPLAQKRPELVKSPGGYSLAELTLDKVMAGEVGAAEFRITPAALHMQAQVARAVGRTQFASNLERAAELTAIPDERILEMYNALRPYRSTRQELEKIADELENVYGAKINAAFVREAASVYERRNRLKA